MKLKKYLAFSLAIAMILSCVMIQGFAIGQEDGTNIELASTTTDPDGYGTITENTDGSKTLNFGENSITVKGGGAIITDEVNGGVLRPDNFRTDGDGKGVLTMPSISLKASTYDKVDLYAAGAKNAAVSIHVGGTEVGSIENINTGDWTGYQVFTADITTTEAEGNVTLNITGEGAKAYCGNYVYVRFYNSQAPTPDPNLPTVPPATAKPTEEPSGDLPLYQDTSYTFEERAADLVSRMTLEEKAGQFTDETTAIPRLEVASYNYWREGLHGVARQGKATSFPSPLSMSNTWNRDLIKQIGTITSTEARAKLDENNKKYNKVNGEQWEKIWNLSYWSPTINMARDPRWGRNEESFGEDPYLTAQLAGQFVDGMQGDDEKYLKVISTLKHFAANNVEGERSSGSSVMDETTLREYYVRAFQDIMEENNAASVMSAYNALTISRNGSTLIARNGQKIDYIASSANSYILNDLLRRNWGFNGYITGDCAAFSNINSKDTLKKALFRDRDISKVPVEEVIPLTFLNGADIDCSLSGGGGADKNIVLASVAGGFITEDKLDVSLYRLFLKRMQTGEFDKGAAYQDITSDIIESDESVAVAEETAEESWVLLKNDNNALPLDENDKNIVIVGPYAAQVILGDYSGVPTKTVTPIDGIKEQMEATYPGANVEHINVLTDTTPIMNIKSINFVDKNSKKSKFDLSKASISGATFEDGIIKDVTKNAKISFPSVDFSTVENIEMEISTGFAPGGKINVHFGASGPKGAVIESVKTEDSDTYAVCSAKYTGANGGYNGIADMELSFEPNEPELIIAKFKEELDNADVIIAYSGTMWGREPSGDSGESNDRESIDLPAKQSHVSILTEAEEYAGKTVVVMQTVGQINVEPFMDKCSAMLWTSYNGQTQGTALGKILTGQVNPSGKLTSTWYANQQLEKNMPFTVQPVKEDGISGWYKNDYSIKSSGTYPGRTYQYHTQTPIYPFGYGLSYTNYEYSNIKLDKTEVDANGSISVSVDVTNTGSVAGKEAVQLYVSVPGADGISLPKQQLKGFDKVELAPGETKTVTMNLSIESLKLFDEENQKVYVNAGEYTVKVAENATDAGLSEKFNVTGSLKSEIKNVTAIPNSLSVHGLILADGTEHETTIDIDSDVSVTMTDEAWFELSDADSVVYTSSNTDVAVVNQDGIVSSRTEEGVATITVEVTINGLTKSTSFPVVNELKIKPNAEDIQTAKDTVLAVYNKLPKAAYSDTNIAKIDQIYNETLANIDTVITLDELNILIDRAINDLNSVPMDNLKNIYNIVSENPKFIEKGVIDYRDGGIPMYNGAAGTVTNIEPYTGIAIQAFDENGNVVDNSKISWQIQKFDNSVRKVAEISETGVLTVYGNGVVQVTAANLTDMKSGTLMIHVNMQIEGEYADNANGANISDSQKDPSGGFNVGNTGDAWVEYKSVKLSNLDEFIIRYASKNNGQFNISLDKTTDPGKLIASGSVAATGGWGVWADGELTVDKTAISNALLSGALDQYGCATIYIQSNATNYDYFRLNYLENNDEEPYIFEKVLNRSDGNMKVTLSYRGSKLATPVQMVAAVYNSDETIKGVTTTEVNGTGEYEISTGAADGDNVSLYIWNSVRDIKPLAQKFEKTYRTPADSEIVVYSLNDSAYDILTSADTDAEEQPYGIVNGLSGYSSLLKAKSACTYTYTDVNEKTYDYSFTNAWKGGQGSETKRCLYFTPKAPCKVTVLFDGGVDRIQKIVQDGVELATGRSVDGKKTAFSAEITDITKPVYTYGGGSNKFVSAIIVEYYGSVSAAESGSESQVVPDENTSETGEDRAVQFTKWGSRDIVLTKNDVTGETKVWRTTSDGSKVQIRTEYFYESDVDYNYDDEYGINKLVEYKGRLYAGCDNGLVIVFTDCAKCFKLKKACDIDIKDMSIKDGIMYVSNGVTKQEINMSDIGGDAIEADEARILAENGGILVDVRTAAEYAEKSADGSVNIPVNTIQEGLADYDKDSVLIIYCAGGSRAETAVQKAIEMGYTNVYNLESVDKLL